MKSNKIIKIASFFASVVLLSLFICYAIMAWDEPSQIPPDGNANSPVNIGGDTQTKTGGFNVSGSVGIGTTSPAAPLDVNGTVKATMVQAPGIVRQVLNSIVTQNVQTSSLSYVDIPGLAITTQTGSSSLFIMWNAGVAVTGTSSRCQIRILVDGVQAGTYTAGGYSYNNGNADINVDSMGGNAVVSVTPGPHTIKLQWKNMSDNPSGTGAGTSYIWPNHIAGYGGSMTIMEITK